jgi:hypothetical protein
VKEKAILALQQKLDEEYRANNDAIKLVLKLLRKNGGATPAPKPKRDGTSSSTNSLIQAAEIFMEAGVEKSINNAIASKTAKFTLSDLVAELPNVNRSTISSVLFRQKDKTIKVVQAGRGRRPTVYEKIVKM